MSTSRIDDLRMVDPVLSTIAQGYSNAAMVADALFPTVTVSKLKGKVPVFGRDAFMVRDTYRAMRASSNRIPPSDLNLISFETKERDVEIALDYIEEEESPDFARYEQRLTKDLMDILLLGKEKEVADYVQNTANFINDLKYEVSSEHAFDDYSESTMIDPILIIRDCMAGVRARISRYPNTMIIGDTSFQALINHPKIVDRIKYSGFPSHSTEILSKLLDIPVIKIGMSVYTADGTTYSDVWGDNIVLAYVDQNERSNRSEFNPSYGYIFQREGKPEIDTYNEYGGKVKVIRNTDNYCMMVTASDAAFLISNTNHAV